MPVLDSKQLNEQLAAKGARWSAAPTNVSALDENGLRARLGVVINRAALAQAMAPHLLAAAPAPAFAPAVDWRNHNGQSHVPPVEDQGNCGSCVSFCTCAVVSSMASIERGQMPDLSEADLHFCSTHGANCGGWDPGAALDQVKTRGVSDETASPYMASFDSPPQIGPDGEWVPHCRPVANMPAHAVKITNWSTLADVTSRKNYLSNNGPCSGVIHVYQDFGNYSTGVYHHVTGADVGLHCIEVIGYSEAEQCWICKNSWGTAWGDHGFFKIAYGEAGIDSEFPFWTASGVVLPQVQRWNGFEDLGGILSSGPAVASWAANRLDTFVKGTDNHMWHKWWDGNAWSGWEDLGGILMSAPAAVSWGPNRIDTFVRGTDNHLWHKWWDGSHWSGWENLGGIITAQPAVSSWSANRLDVFAKGTDNAMWHLWWDGTRWNGWESLGGVIDDGPAAVSWGPNRIDTFGRGTDNHMWHKWWDGSHWSGWEDLGGIITSGPAAASWAANRLDCFVKGTDNHLWHKWWDGSHWSGWENLGGVLDYTPGAVSWGPNRIDTFVTGMDNHMWHKWWG